MKRLFLISKYFNNCSNDCGSFSQPFKSYYQWFFVCLVQNSDEKLSYKHDSQTFSHKTIGKRLFYCAVNFLCQFTYLPVQYTVRYLWTNDFGTVLESLLLYFDAYIHTILYPLNLNRLNLMKIQSLELN